MEVSCRSRHLVFILLFVSLFIFPVAVAEKVHFDITSETGVVFIDYFKYSERAGHLELNVTDISIAGHIASNANLSQVGFFLSEKFILPSSSYQCLLFPDVSMGTTTIYTLDKLQGNGTNSFHLIFTDINKTGEYILYFENCLSNLVKMKVQSTMYNLIGDREKNGSDRPVYLASNKIRRVKMYLFFSLAQFSLACFWAYSILTKQKVASVKRIHVIMVLVPFLKAWSLIFSVLHDYYIFSTGCGQCFSSYLLGLASGFLTEAPLIFMLVLMCSGWSLVRQHLLPKEKVLLVCIIPLELFLNSLVLFLDQLDPVGHMLMYIFPGYAYPASTGCRYVLLLVAIGSSTEVLKELGESEYGKAAESVKYIKLFRSLLCLYEIYVSVWTLYGNALEIFTSYMSLAVLVKELSALVFFVVIGYRMRPELHETEFLMINDDVEKAASKALMNHKDIWVETYNRIYNFA